MPKNNPYIELVIADTDIFHIPEVAYKQKGDWAQYFGNDNPLVLEIGTGMGNFFSRQVGEHPNKNFIGMEIRYKRCYQTAEKSRTSSKLQPLSFRMKGEDSGEDNKKEGRKNFTIIKEFAQKVTEIFGEEELSETYIFFPDPWANKDRQRKHRLMQEPFLKDLYKATKAGGKIFFKTDHAEYFESTIQIIENSDIWKIQNISRNYEESEVFDINNITEFESFYRGEKTNIHYLELVKK